MFPERLKPGDEIRVISPSSSLKIVSESNVNIAKSRFEEMGLNVTFSKHSFDIDEFNSSSIESRVLDIHDAFLDKNVKGVFTAIGGANSNQLLTHIDYDIIKSNPKIFCGYSDITALSNAIYKKTKLVNYNGPAFSTFGMEKGIEYTIEYFKKCIFSDKKFSISCSNEWSDDHWYRDQQKRSFIKNNGCLIINPGYADGTVIGGNQCTLNLLHGTEYMPSLQNKILIIEDDNTITGELFDRDLQSIIHQKGFSGVKGILIGRFQKESNISNADIIKIIKRKRELDNIPVIANLDFGHTTPQLTLPIGGRAKISAENNTFEFEIIKH